MASYQTFKTTSPKEPLNVSTYDLNDSTTNDLNDSTDDLNDSTDDLNDSTTHIIVNTIKPSRTATKRFPFRDPAADFPPLPATSKPRSHRRCAVLLPVHPSKKRTQAPQESQLRVIVIPREAPRSEAHRILDCTNHRRRPERRSHH